MPLLKIIKIPDPLLNKRSSVIENITPDILKFACDLEETMLSNKNCVGLAAPQASKNIRLIAVDISLHPKNFKNHGRLILINPVILLKEGNVSGREGCLSVPDWTGNVARAQNITVSAVDKGGNPVKLDTDGFESVVLQHEIDHLDGILFLDRVNSIKTDVFRRKHY
jgi:peptide deformylase